MNLIIMYFSRSVRLQSRWLSLSLLALDLPADHAEAEQHHAVFFGFGDKSDGHLAVTGLKACKEC